MARPVNADAQATRSRILGSALDLFAAAGLDGVTTREVAKAAGVSLAMLHHYFGNKEALYAACIDAMLGELAVLGSELNAALDGQNASPAMILERAVRIGFRFARARRSAILLFQRSVVSSGEIDERVRDASVLPFLTMLSEAVAARTGRTAAELRLPLQSAIFLAVRYAISSDADLVHLAGLSTQRPMAPQLALVLVEDHLVQATLALLDLRAGA